MPQQPFALRLGRVAIERGIAIEGFGAGWHDAFGVDESSGGQQLVGGIAQLQQRRAYGEVEERPQRPRHARSLPRTITGPAELMGKPIRLARCPMWKFALIAPVLVAVFLSVGAAPAQACGGLIGPNGAVNLVRTTTLAGYADGVEHYVTAFQFAGGSGEFGSIIPLPGVPTTVERGGDWTLQRQVRETAPPVRVAAPPRAASTAAA